MSDPRVFFAAERTLLAWVINTLSEQHIPIQINLVHAGSRRYGGPKIPSDLDECRLGEGH